MSSETIANADLVNDNYWDWYAQEEFVVTGFLANFTYAENVVVKTDGLNMTYLWDYLKQGNLITVGVMPGKPNSLVNNIPLPLVIGTIDEYVKWRANESMWNLKQDNFIRRRNRW